MDRVLWEASGHWQKFGDEMFVVPDGNRAYALKPMSCPGHIQVFNKRVRSFRDLPLRYCEFGACHRNEPSGALQGLARTRAFVQDDAHIFCAAEHVRDEVCGFSALLRRIYAELGFADVRVMLATRPAERAGSVALWDRAEETLGAAAVRPGLTTRSNRAAVRSTGPSWASTWRTASAARGNAARSSSTSSCPSGSARATSIPTGASRSR